MWVRSWDKVVCDYNATTYNSDVMQCDYVCSSDGDCSDEINLCIAIAENNCL
jgi:hypothetical protein